MRLVVDYKKCRKAGQCSYLHPELFKTDDSGAPVVLVEHLWRDPPKAGADPGFTNQEAGPAAPPPANHDQLPF